MAGQILSIDIGTTSLKTAIFTFAGEKAASAIREYALLTPGVSFVEAPCRIYMDSIRACLSDMAETAPLREIRTVGFSVQGETLIFLDQNGTPVRDAIVWMDNRAGEQARKLKARFGDDECYRVTGQVSFEACWPVSKVMWVREREPETYARVRHILLLEDYILYLLTGRFVSECSLLCSTEYWDIRTKRYWGELLDFAGIDPSFLPEIVEPGQSLGLILPRMAEELGLPPDVRICSGCLDQAAAAVGVGNIRPGIVSENIGAALAICAPTGRLLYDPGRIMPVHYFAVPDTYMMHSFTTGGMCLRWFRDCFCQREKEVQAATGLDSYDLMDLEAARVPPGCDRLLALPHLQGSMAPDVNLNAKGVFYGVTLKHTRAHFIRSIMESLGYVIRRNLEAISDMGLCIGQLRTMGGGSKSDLWNQIKADITGRELTLTGYSQDTACLGAAILAGTAFGAFPDIGTAVSSMVHTEKVYHPNVGDRAVYERQYRKFNILFSALSELYELDAQEL